MKGKVRQNHKSSRYLKSHQMGEPVLTETRSPYLLSPSMRGLPNFNPADKKFWPDQPELGFSPEKNKAVIEGTIKKYEAMRARKQKLFRKELAERVDATASYLTGNYGIHRSRPVERYFGKRYLAYLRGQDIVDGLKRIDTDQPSNLRHKVWNEKGVYLGGPKQK